MNRPCRILSLDLSTKTGYAILDGNILLCEGLLTVRLEDFNVNDYPERSTLYPYNIVKAADEMADKVYELVTTYNPDFIIIENTVRGMNRNTQRCLEFIHKAVLDSLGGMKERVKYMDPSRWRSLIGLRLSPEDKKHNALVRKGQAKGKLTPKHLSVRRANELFGKSFKLKDNDKADAILLGIAFRDFHQKSLDKN